MLYYCRRAALQIWKQRLGSDATYQKLINVFERAGYRTYAEIVRNTVCDDESDSSDYDEPIPQPEAYPQLKVNPPPSPKPSPRRFSSCDEYLHIDSVTAMDLPKGETLVASDKLYVDYKSA